MRLDGLGETVFQEKDAGLIPRDWEVQHIENIISEIISGDWGDEFDDLEKDLTRCTVIRGTDFPAAMTGLLTNAPVRYIKSSRIPKKQLKHDDILIEISGGSKTQATGRILQITVDLVKKSDGPLLCTNFVKLLRPDCDFVDAGFFSKYWLYLYELGRTRTYEKRTTGIRNFKLADFMQSEKIPLPPLPEQRRIAAALNAIQDEIAAQDDLIHALREFKRSAMARLFTYGAGETPAATKMTEVGEIPVGWELVAIKELGEVVTGRTPSTKRPEYYGDEFMFISPAVLSERRYVKSSDKWLSKEGIEVARQLPKKTVLVTCIGSIGKTGLTTERASASNQQINAIISNSDVDSHFVYYLMTFNAQYIVKHADRTTVPIINKSNFQTLLVSLPPLREQQRIAGILDVIEDKLESEQDRKSALQDFFSSMLQQLMTGQIRLMSDEGLPL